MSKNPKYIGEKKFPPNLYKIVEMKGSDLPITAFARIMCQHCGLWGRAILCPPYLYQTFPQFTTIESSRKYFSSIKNVFLYIFRNDGTKRWWWKSRHDNFKYLDLIVRKGRQLKGCEASSAREITRMMYKIRRKNKKAGWDVECFIQGHCDLCGRKCPNRGNPPCKKGGMLSLEATGINVYKLLSNLGIEYEYPVQSYLTQVTMMTVKGRR